MAETEKEIRERAHALIKSKRESLAFASPELVDFHWDDLEKHIKEWVRETRDGETHNWE